MTIFFKIFTATAIVWTAILLGFLLLGCSTPYSEYGAPRPTKGKTLAAYQLGQSDAVKRQYWILRNMQLGKAKSEEVAYRTRYYTFNIQPDPDAAINRVPYNVTLPILE